MGSTRSQVAWVNIWQDPDGAGFVADHRSGNETVPTAVTGAGNLIPAEPKIIKDHLAG